MGWEDILGKVGDAVVDWATDPETIDKAVDYFMREEGMTYQDAVKAAQKQAVMNNPNVMSPFGSSITDFDDETGQATVHRVMPQGTLDLVNSLGRRAAGGEINTPRQMGEGSMRQTSQALMDSHARGRGITPTAQNWWEPTAREAVDWTDFTNSYDLGTGGSGGDGDTGGLPSEGRNPDLDSGGVGNAGGHGGSGGSVPGYLPILPGDQGGDNDPYSGGIHDTINDMVGDVDVGSQSAVMAWIMGILEKFGPAAADVIATILTGQGMAGDLARQAVEEALAQYEGAAPESSPWENPNDINDILDERFPWNQSPFWGGGLSPQGPTTGTGVTGVEEHYRPPMGPRPPGPIPDEEYPEEGS